MVSFALSGSRGATLQPHSLNAKQPHNPTVKSPGLKNCMFVVRPPSTVKASTSPVRFSQPKAGRAVYRCASVLAVWTSIYCRAAGATGLLLFACVTLRGGGVACLPSALSFIAAACSACHTMLRQRLAALPGVGCACFIRVYAPEILHALFLLDPATGRLRHKATRCRIKAGSYADTTRRADGYRQVALRLNGK